MSEWGRDRWWRVIAPDGSMWCETSDEQEARDNMRPGDTLQSLWIRTEHEWRIEAFRPRLPDLTTSEWRDEG